MGRGHRFTKSPVEAFAAGRGLAAATVRDRVARLPALTARAGAVSDRSRPGRSPSDTARPGTLTAPVPAPAARTRWRRNRSGDVRGPVVHENLGFLQGVEDLSVQEFVGITSAARRCGAARRRCPESDRRSRSRSRVAKREKDDRCRRKRPNGRPITQAATMGQ